LYRTQPATSIPPQAGLRSTHSSLDPSPI
jgi:hypothetical protein